MTASITDFSQFTDLRGRLDQHDPAVLREVASQFEALFIQQLLKNMRAGELSEPLFGESDQHKMYQEMMDQQLALKMSSGNGIGLADMLVQQLGGEAASVQPTSERFFLQAIPGRPPAGQPAIAHDMSAASQEWTNPASFVRDVWPHAERVARRLNVAPEAIVAQAALETGWGAHVIQRDSGASSNNLFGIKAGGGWSGGSVSRPTVEYIDGVAEYKVQRFRAYPDIATTFDDYARLIEENPRYATVRESGQNAEVFATALQDAGYATDPLYAAKITRVLNGETMRAAINDLQTH
jgi:flagellar protein FlgJ